MRPLYTVLIAVHDVESAGIWLRKDMAYERNRKGRDKEGWRFFWSVWHKGYQRFWYRDLMETETSGPCDSALGSEADSIFRNGMASAWSLQDTAVAEWP